MSSSVGQSRVADLSFQVFGRTICIPTGSRFEPIDGSRSTAGRRISGSSKGARDHLAVGRGHADGGPRRPFDAPARARFAVPVADPPRARDRLRPRRRDRVPDLLRSRADRPRGLCPPLRRDVARRPPRPVVSPLRRRQPDGPLGDQPPGVRVEGQGATWSTPSTRSRPSGRSSGPSRCSRSRSPCRRPADLRGRPGFLNRNGADRPERHGAAGMAILPSMVAERSPRRPLALDRGWAAGQPLVLGRSFRTA